MKKSLFISILALLFSVAALVKVFYPCKKAAGASASAQGAGQPSGDRRGPRGDRGDRRGPRGDRGERRGGAPKRNNKQ